MANINSITLSGRLTKDADFKEFSSSSKFTFSIAVAKRVKNGDTWESKANFFDIEPWNMKHLKEALTKGREVVISGELDASEYTNPEGQKVKRVFVRAERIQAFHTPTDKKEEPKSENKWNDIP